ncbi:trk system potassium uptake protein TrkH [Butyrivibrio sp. ob235]|uniref:TrkH family potassium uptake protein n=1 Tax=Butyrivibrio sp. ob235 TaxID=1761780 RepID=UPI0008CD8B72|nr:potassium transporter TrkG [Butyrivibrio sp. ob235]SEL69022.1 trk system potassium uptake protein TrkH [Butyrivibrio sp. ob235]
MRVFSETKIEKSRLTSTQIIVLGFLLAIVVGSFLLMIPAATARGEHTDFITALFTATTSICVTGLVVVDTFSHWSFLGQLIILILIQIGGFGVITLYSAIMMLMKKKFSLSTRLLIQDYYNLDSIHGLIKFLIRVIKDTFVVEGIGAVLYSFVFIPKFGFFKGIWVSVFNAVSAFCNAGMDVMGANSLIDYQTNIPVNLITITLIVLGGVGYVVWFDFIENLKRSVKHRYNIRIFWKRLGEHSKLVINLTLFLLISGTLLVMLFEWDNPDTIGKMTVGNKILASFFQSVTFRTAGFATVPQESLTPSTCIVGCMYMFIGGSPVGTAGGIKTVTIFVVLLNVFSFIRNRTEPVVFSRAVSEKLINKASAIVMSNLMLTMALMIALMQVCDAPALSAAYEIFSATGTVGLSRSLTASLNVPGMIVVMIGMYAGRIGPISMALFFSTKRSDKNDIRFSNGHFIVG